MKFVDLHAQYSILKQDIDRRISDVVARCEFVMGAEVNEFERRLAEFCDVEHVVAVASGTDALLVALMAADVGAGDEVITSPFSFAATVEAIVLLGARPVFADIDAATFNIDPEQIEAAVTRETRAIIAVSLYGQCAQMDAIEEIAKRHNCIVIEDAAQSIGASYEGRRSGSLSEMACTSFYPTKPLGCYGDGGACLTKDSHLAAQMRMIRDHGQDGRYQHRRLGINSRLDTLQAAVLLAKLPTFEDELDARERAATRYGELFEASNLAGVKLPEVRAGNRSAFAQYTIRIPQRDQVQRLLTERGIPSAVHYPRSLHQQPAFAKFYDPKQRLPVAEQAATEVLSLPMHPFLSMADQKTVVNGLRDAIQQLG